MKVLVTGAAGFVGSWVCRELAGRGIDVRAVDCFLPDSYSADTKRSNWAGLESLADVELIECDLREPIPGGLLAGIETVVNEAGMPGLVKSWTDFELYLACNVGVVERLARAAVESDVAHFVQISTSSVYGALAQGNELSPLRPTSPYGVTKLAAEELVRAYERSHGLQYTILRYFSVYGPGQRPDMAYHRIINAVLRSEQIEIYGDGSQTRSNTFVADCAAATVEAVIRRPVGETLNIAGSEQHSLLTAIGFIEEAVGRSALLEFKPPRLGDQLHTGGDTSLARSILGFIPQTDLRSGLAQQARWQDPEVIE